MDIKEATDGRPHWVTEDKFWDAENQAVRTDAIHKAYIDMRKDYHRLKAAEGTLTVPESADGYFDENDFSEEGVLQGFEGLAEGQHITKDDPLLSLFVTNAVNAGVPKEAFRAMLAPMAAGIWEQLGAGPVDVDAELAKLDTPEAPGRGVQMAVAINHKLDSLVAKGALSQEERDRIAAVGRDANGIMALAKFVNVFGRTEIPIGPEIQSVGTYNKSDWSKAVRSEEYAKNPEFRKKWDAIGAKFFPGSAGA